MRSRPIHPTSRRTIPTSRPRCVSSSPAWHWSRGRTGFETIDGIIRDAPTQLEPEGWLVLEHGWKQAEGVRQRLVRQGFVHGVTSHADLAGHERVTEGQWPGTQPG